MEHIQRAFSRSSLLIPDSVLCPSKLLQLFSASFPLCFSTYSGCVGVRCPLFVRPAEATISPHHYITPPFLCLTVIIFRSHFQFQFCFLLICLELSKWQQQHKPPIFPPSRLFPWSWSTLVTTSTLLPIISTTHCSDLPTSLTAVPFIQQPGQSQSLFHSTQKTPLNWQQNSWSVYCLWVCVVFVHQHMCVCSLWNGAFCAVQHQVTFSPNVISHNRNLWKWKCPILFKKKEKKKRTWLINQAEMSKG